METWTSKTGEKISTTRRRQYRVTLRMDVDEMAYFLQRVEESGLSQQEFLRRCATGQPIINTDGLEKLLPELKHQGTNLNQLAHVANATGHVPAALDQALKELSDVWQQLRQQIRVIR